MPLSTEGLIDEIKRFRSDKLALVALIGSMGVESEIDALARLREIKTVASEQLTRENAALRLALSHFADPQHWAVSRRFATPEHVWIGTVQTHPSVLAKEALDG